MHVDRGLVLRSARQLLAAGLLASTCVLHSPAFAQISRSGHAGLSRGAEAAGRTQSASEQRFSDRPVHVQANAGFGTLVGLLGITAGYSAHDRLELGAGIGANAAGLMGGPYVRVRPLIGRRRTGTLDALALDLGLSAGAYRDSETPLFSAMSHTRPEDKSRYRVDGAYFLQVEISWQTLNVAGAMVRIGAGGTTLLNPGAMTCEKSTSETALGCGRAPSFFPVLVAAAGIAF